MPIYGVTPKGIVVKRLDEIMNELHDTLSASWGVNTRLNPKSYLNVQLTAYADKIAELYEFGEQIYHSMYPFSAEGISLDNAVQYGGVTREDPRPTYYPIHCECVEGTTIPRGSIIKTNTNPEVRFLNSADTTVSRSSCNRIKIKLAVLNSNEIYTIAIDGEIYNYVSSSAASESEILNGIANAVSNPDFDVSVEGLFLNIDSIDVQRTHAFVLGGNLTTQSVTSVVNYASEMFGEISLPDSVVTQIVTAVPGLVSVVNLCPYIAGRLLETDVELRQSYTDKIYIRSNRMLESIKSALLRNVQGVVSVACFQNDTNIVDAWGRWPHSVEVVIEGGSDYEIALQIWDKKCDGISTFGSVEVIVPGDEGEPVTIRFNRPQPIWVWYRITISLNASEVLPPNYVEAIKTLVMNAMTSQDVTPGKSIIPQRLIEGRIYGNVPGISYIDTKTYYTDDANLAPGNYVNGMIPITPRQRAVTDETRIEVVLSV